MSTNTSNYNLIKPEDTDNADLKIFVGQNMDTIDAELLKRIQKDINGSYTNTTNSAFMASSNVAQTVGAMAVIKLVFGLVGLDVLGEYDKTLGRFTAKASGIYFFTACVRYPAPASGTKTGQQAFLAFYKNGVNDTRVQQLTNGANTMTGTTATIAYNPIQAHGNVIMQLNAGDYVEVYAYADLATTTQGKDVLTYDTTFFRGIKLA